MYLWHYFTINSSISGCDPKCETRNAEPEIGTERLSQIPSQPTGWRVCIRVWPANSQQAGFLDGSRPEPTLVSGLEPNQPVFPVQTRTAGWLPAPGSNTTGVGCISDTEKILTESWSLSQLDAAAALKLPEWASLPPAMSAKDHPGGGTQILNVRQIQRIQCEPFKSDKDSTTESILETEDWVSCNGYLDNPNDSRDDCVADDWPAAVEVTIIYDPEWLWQWDVSSMPNVPGLIWPTWNSQRQAEKVLLIINAIEMRRHRRVKNIQHIICQCFTSFFRYLD